MKPGVDEARKRYLAAELRRYWPRAEETVLRLGIPAAPAVEPEPLPPRLATVALPEWAGDLGVDGGLLVPRQFVIPGPEEIWRRVDWWSATYWYLNGVAERAHEQAHGPVHSYSFRLKNWDARLWERAWVNRIALFLRRWAARESHQKEEVLFGALPAAEVLVTHDVDAIRKTPAIRIKQTAFHGYNALRYAARGRPGSARDKLASAVRFLFSSASYWHFDEIARAEQDAGIKSCFFVYGGDLTGRSLKQALFDPAYDVREPRLAQTLRTLSANGWQIGLHQSFDAWHGAAMAVEKSRVEEALGANITMCRQHWLRFSWRETWRAQQAAGLETDATLGFNDRPGFRNGAALRFHPWDEASGAPLRLVSLPMVLMDSQLYDYAALTEAEREAEMSRWLDEVRAVAGVGTVIWHQHVLGPDYGWRPGLDALLARAAQRGP